MMKPRFFFAVLFAALMGMMVSCNKDMDGDDSMDTRSNSEKIIGVWQADLEKSYERYSEPGYEQTTYLSEQSNAVTMEFGSDGMLTYTTTGGSGADTWTDSWSDPYEVVGDTLVWDVWHFYISQLDDHTLKMESVRAEDRTLGDGSIMHTEEVKHYELNR